MMSTFRVMTWNVHDGIGGDGRYDLIRLERLIRAADADLVGLQEVGRRWLPDSQFDDELVQLALAVGYFPFFAPIIDLPDDQGLGRRQYGCGILSRWPLRLAQDHGLSRIGTYDPARRLHRLPGFPEVVVEPAPGRRYHFFCTHLYWRDAGVRRLEAEEMVQILRPLIQQGEPCILVGDFNAEPGDAELAPLFAADSGLVDAGGTLPTYPAVNPTKRIDLVFASRSLQVGQTVVWPSPTASDHRPVVVDLGWDENPMGQSVGGR